MSEANRLLAALRDEARAAPQSGIVEVFNYGRDRDGLIPLWAGEGEIPTPRFICDAATRSLAAGETFYTYQRGLPELRTALADYHRRVFGGSFAPERFYAIGSGMLAICTAIQCVAGKGDEVVLPAPAWPNFAAALGIAGATPAFVPMRFAAEGDDAGWRLDLDRLFDAVGERTTAIFLNSPCNPTGWTATHDELKAILAFARKRGLWIVADEVYSRFYFRGDAARAPSFYDVMEEDDRILFVNTFSKNWAMTGWRIGWIGAHPALGQVLENLVQYATSGVPAFSQRAAIAALSQGEEFLRFQIARAAEARDIVASALADHPRARFVAPDGTFYAFFAVEGFADTAKLALRLVDEANIGIAPGTAFGPGGEPFIRICLLRSADQVQEAVDRLTGWLDRQ